MPARTMVNVSFSNETIAQIDRLRAGTSGRPEVKRAAWVAWATEQWIASQAHADPPRKRPAAVDTRRALATPTADAALHEGARLAAARGAAGLTHAALGAATSMSRGQVQRAERCAGLDGYPKLRAWLEGQGRDPSS